MACSVNFYEVVMSGACSTLNLYIESDLHAFHNASAYRALLSSVTWQMNVARTNTQIA